MGANNNRFPTHKSKTDIINGGISHSVDYQSLDKKQVMEWFKQCIEDFPEQRDSTFMEEDIWAYNHWFKKWFSQFRNNKE